MIRKAILKDMPTLLDKLIALLDESDISLVANKTKMESFLKMVIESHTGLCLMAEGGLLVATATSPWFSDEVTASDIAVYVDPDKRGTGLSERLIKMYEEWAKELGATAIELGTITGIKSEKVSRFYQSLGFKKVGYLHRKV